MKPWCDVKGLVVQLCCLRFCTLGMDIVVFYVPKLKFNKWNYDHKVLSSLYGCTIKFHR